MLGGFIFVLSRWIDQEVLVELIKQKGGTSDCLTHGQGVCAVVDSYDKMVYIPFLDVLPIEVRKFSLQSEWIHS